MSSNNNSGSKRPYYARQPHQQDNKASDHNPNETLKPITAFSPGMSRETCCVLFVTQGKHEELRAAFENEEVFPNDFVNIGMSLTGGMSLVHLATTNKQPEVLRVLLEYGCNPDPVEVNCGYTPLFFCCITKDEFLEKRLELAQLLCDYGADPGIKDKFGGSCLDRCVQVGGPSENRMASLLKRVLLDREQAQVEANNNNNNNNQNHVDPTSNDLLDNRLRSEQENNNNNNNNNNNAAIDNRQQAAAATATATISSSAPRRKRSDVVSTQTLLGAICQGKLEVLQQFEEFVDPEFLDERIHDHPLVYFAATTNQPQCLRWLMDHGASVDYRGIRGESCLFSAISVNSKECCKILVNQGADLSVRAYGGSTCYTAARKAYDFDDIVALMLQRLTNNAISSPKQVPDFLLLLIKTQNVRLMRVLFDCEVINVDLLRSPHPAGNNIFYLHFACENDKPDSLREMMEMGANIDQQNLVGNTPLHVAIKARSVGCTETLINANANMEIRNGSGESVTDCAIRGRNDNIIRAIEAGWKKFVKSGKSTNSGNCSSSSGNNNNYGMMMMMNNNNNRGSGSGALAGDGGGSSSSSFDMMGAPAMTNGMLIQSTFSIPLDDLTLAYLSRFPRSFIFDVTDIELQQHLASGGGGAVHLARIKSQDRLVAAKIFKDADSIKKTVDECERAIKLRHKNIVQHVGLTVSKSAFSTDLVLLMELGEGSLQDALRTGQGPLQFDFDTVYSFMKQVAEGLMYIHSKNMLWLDGKPGNLLFFENHTKLKLIDFGLSRDICKDKTHDTVSRAGAGTLRYMSKSQLNEEQVRKTDDVYSYGATFFNLVCGFEPWLGCSMPQIMTGNLIDKFEPRPGCPEVLAAVVKACIAVDPKERPQSGVELMRLLLPEDEEMPAQVSMQPQTSGEGSNSNANGNDDNTSHDMDVTEQIDMNVTW